MACQTERSAARISWRDGPRREPSDGTARAKDRNLSLKRLMTRRWTLSNMARAVAKTDSALRTVGSTGPDCGTKAVGPGASSSASRRVRRSWRSDRGRRESCHEIASASVQRERQGNQGEAPDENVCWSADRNSGAGMASGVRSSPG